MNTMIIIEPTGGLANRLRAIDSAIAFKKEKDVKLNVLWALNSDCNGKFSDLFLVPKEFNRLIEIKSKFFTRVLKKFYRIIFSLAPNYYLNNKKINDWKKKSGSAFSSITAFLESLGSQGSVYIQTVHRFFDSPTYYTRYSALIPKHNLQKIINQYDTKNMVGVHIRRTDNKKSIEYSPLEKFIDCMNNEINLNSEVSFFLATDDLETKIILKKTFSSRILTRDVKKLNRNDPVAIQEAVIDLFCLAKCKKIIGSYWSSFTDIASEIYGIEKIIIYDEKVDARGLQSPH